MVKSGSGKGSKTLCLIGGGKGARYIINRIAEIQNSIGNVPIYRDIVFVDDNVSKPIDLGELNIQLSPGTIESLGKFSDVDKLDPEKYDLFITFSKDMKLRSDLFDRFRDRFDFACLYRDNPPLITMGVGNFVFDHSLIEPFASIGDNNVISSATVINHHNVIGDSNLFGPGCFLSGSVRVGNRCRIGGGVVLEPGVKIGDDCDIASGTVITTDLPAKTRVLAYRDMKQKGVYQGNRIIRN
ncbi:MAG TPA: DapH/DapD/GlmU-related protein [Acidobacteriota bacterium]|nr:DapH/DapD/GlmU-related protein [Acidobacteriota bacterium]